MSVIALYQGVIQKMERDHENGNIRLLLDCPGQVIEGHKSPESKETSIVAAIVMKPLVLGELRFGQPLFITVSTEDPRETGGHT